MGVFYLGKFIDLTGKQFGRLTVLKRVENYLNELDEQRKENAIDNDFNGDYYDYYGVSRGMFV